MASYYGKLFKILFIVFILATKGWKKGLEAKQFLILFLESTVASDHGKIVV